MRKTTIMSNQSFVGGRLEIMGLDEILGWGFRKRRRSNIQQLKARAASGDQRAIAHLARLRAALGVPNTATTATPNTPTLFAYPEATSYVAPNYPAPAYQTPYFDASLSQDPYGPAPQPTIDVFQGDLLGILLDNQLNPERPRGSEFVLGTLTTDQNQRRKIAMAKRQEILGKDEILGRALDSNLNRLGPKAQFVLGRALDGKLNRMRPKGQYVLGDDTLTEIVTSGDDALTEIVTSGAFVGDEEKALAREGGASEQAALRRRTAASCGYNRHWAHMRGEASAQDLATIKKLADGGNKKAKKILAKLEKLARANMAGDDSSQTEKQAARKIIDDACASKTITRDSLKKAIWLYAGKQSTEKERTLVGSKMIALLNKKQVKLS